MNFTTLESVGEKLATIVTMNDVHLGESECGEIEGVSQAQFRTSAGDRPYPDVMNESVIADAKRFPQTRPL